MAEDIPNLLKHSVDNYLQFFDKTTTLGSIMFGMTVFLMVRAVGFVQDDDFTKIGNKGLICVIGISALVMVVCGFFAQNLVLSFYVELLRNEPF